MDIETLAGWQAQPDGSLQYRDKAASRSLAKQRAAELGHRIGQFRPCGRTYDQAFAAHCQRCAAAIVERQAQSRIYAARVLNEVCPGSSRRVS